MRVDGTKLKTEKIFKFPFWLFLIFSVFTIGLLSIGYYFISHYEKSHTNYANDQLLTIADFKVNQIIHWRKERMGDAEIIKNNISFTRDLNKYLKNKISMNSKNELERWLISIKNINDYKNIYILDSKNNIRFSVDDSKNQPIPLVEFYSNKARVEKRTIFTDFHKDVSPNIHLDLYIPLFMPDKKEPHYIGSIVLKINPAKFIYPLIQSWPTPSESSESLLLEKSGDSIIFLNELRHRKNTALTLKLSITDSNILGVKAVKGSEGIRDGVDYRGVPVLGAVRSIPNTGWFIVVKTDWEEIYSPVRTRKVITFIAVFALIFGAGASLVFFWIRQRSIFYRRNYDFILEKQALTKHFEYLTKYANDIILMIDEKLMIVEVNERAVKEYGYSREEIMKMSILDLRTLEPVITFEEQINEMEKYDGFIYETKHRRKDGSSIPVEISSRTFYIENQKFYQKIIRNITERKQAEEEVEKYRHQFESFFRKHNAVFLLMNGYNGQIIDANDSALQFYGYTLSQMKLMKIGNINKLPPEELEAERVRAVKEERKYFVVPHLLENGETRIVEVHTTPVVLSDETFLFSIIHDITERKHIEEALLASEVRYRRLFEAAQDGILILNAETGLIVDVNPFMEKMLNYSREQLIRKAIWEIGLFRDIVANQSKFMELQQKDYIRFEDLPLESADGQKIEVEFVSNVYQVNKQKVIQCNIRDITERKQWEKALRESEKKFHSLFENMIEGVALHEIVSSAEGKAVDYRILDVNPAYEGNTGLKAERSRGALATVLYGIDPPPYLEEYDKVAKTGEPFIFETYYEPMDKRFRISVFSPKKGQFATVFEDITERKRKEEELHQKNEEMARFTYTVSHDLKSPLVTIKSFTGFLEQDILKQDKNRMSSDINYIKNAADKMGNLLDELLELSRIGRKTNPPVEVKLQSLVKEAMDLLAGQIAKSNVRIKITSEPVTILGDRIRLVEIFQNLIDNAIKFMGIQQNPLVEIGSEQINDDLTFFVKDNGNGIDPRFQAKLFGLFEKLDVGSEGTGIGLALVKKIIELHGGKIWIYSEGLNKGTTVYFTLAKAKKL